MNEHASSNHHFRPLPFFGGPHAQTILSTMFRTPRHGLPYQTHHLQLPDGDKVLYYDSKPRQWRDGDPMALLVHGLSGSHLSGYMLRLARLLVPRGFRVVRMNLRGAGSGLRWSRRTYNAACSDDVRAVVEEMHRWSPASPIAVTGFSLGGNIVLKMAGEAAERPLAGLHAVAAISPPTDLEACSDLLAKPENRFYDRYFARELVAIIRKHRLFFPDQPVVRFPADLTLRQFDDLHTAPRGGFDGAADYYRRAASLPLIPRITVPTFIMTASDDPFIAVEPIEDLRKLPHLEVNITTKGGHLGFLGFDGKGWIRWLEGQVAEWITRMMPPQHVA